jgi:hypothetical protein
MTASAKLQPITLNSEQQKLLAAYPAIPPSVYHLLGYFLFFMG